MLVFDLASQPPTQRISNRIRAEFLTPTEIKSDGTISRDVSSFSTLFSRLHQRITFLAAHYGSTPYQMADANLIDAARKIVTVSQNLREVDIERFSTRTRQTHPLSGFVGDAVYEGDFSLLWPWLLASQWTGVGRQTVWGKGHIRWTPE